MTNLKIVGKIKAIDVRKCDVASYGGWKVWAEDCQTKTILYLYPEGENLLDQLINRRYRPHVDMKRDLVPSLLAALGMPADTKVRWSQKAGCSCGCSPGFLVLGDRGKTASANYTLVE